MVFIGGSHFTICREGDFIEPRSEAGEGAGVEVEHAIPATGPVTRVAKWHGYINVKNMANVVPCNRFDILQLCLSPLLKLARKDSKVTVWGDLRVLPW